MINETDCLQIPGMGVDFFETVHVAAKKESTPVVNEFDESKYDKEWL